MQPGRDTLAPLALVGVVLVMILPLPSLVLDLLLACSIALSLVILLVGLYVTRPLDFSTFPSVLLVVTLFRLALNVASTRLILLHGHEGPAAAGHVIQAFGGFVVGGSYVVGAVVFCILVVINFAVITKGAGRIAEVAARFTLDALPGKQLAIDAELNSGLATEAQARARRRQVEAEADFYGAMDGASKFVRGDAIAGLVITAINIVGGFVIGVAQQGQDAWTAAQTYTLLTIGDGLVSQIPALLVSTAAGLVVTRAASGGDLGSDVTAQLFASPRVLGAAAGIVGTFALVPGLPFLPFVVLAAALGTLAWRGGVPAAPTAESPGAPKSAKLPDDRADVLAPLDVLELHVGFELVRLVDGDERGNDLVGRVRRMRAQLAHEMGFVVPPIHIRDDLALPPRAYTIVLKGIEIARGEVRPNGLLAIDPGTVATPIDGTPTREPAFGLDALWIPSGDRDRAQLAGYTVVDPVTVVLTHVTELVRRHALELLGRQDVQSLLDGVAKTRPKIVEELVPQHLSLGAVQKVLQNLLREGVSIRDLPTILEALADHAGRTKDPDALTEVARHALGRAITNRLLDEGGELVLMTLAAPIERALLDALTRTDDGTQLVIEPSVAQRLLARLADWGERFATERRTPVLLCGAALRPHLRRVLERYLPALAIISPPEIPAGVRVRSLGAVALDAA